MAVLSVFAKRDKDHGLVIVATNQLQTLDAMTIYAKRWEIEFYLLVLKVVVLILKRRI